MKIRRCPICDSVFELMERIHVRNVEDRVLVWRCGRGCYETVADEEDRRLMVERVENPEYREGDRVTDLWIPGEWDAGDFVDPVGRWRGKK